MHTLVLFVLLKEGGKSQVGLSFNKFFCGLHFPKVILKNSLLSLNKQKYCKSNGWSKLLVSNHRVHFLLESISKATKIRITLRDTPKPPQQQGRTLHTTAKPMILSHELVKPRENAVNGACTNSSWIINSSFPLPQVEFSASNSQGSSQVAQAGAGCAHRLL